MAPRRVRERTAHSAPTSARRPWWLIAVGLAAALLIGLATLPATLLGAQLSRLGLEATALTGSVWTGQARGLSWRSAPLGDLRWSLSPLALLRGRIGGELVLRRADGSLSTGFGVSFAGSVYLQDVRADLPVEVLSALPIGMPRGWRGRLTGLFDEIVVSDGWPTTLRGTLDMDDLVAPPPRNASIGSYHVVMPARVTDKEGPFSFEGRFTLGRDRSFLLDGTLAPRGSTPPALARSLELLGPADAAGRRPVSVSGTL
jgi:general secretion pathway protein N